MQVSTHADNTHTLAASCKRRSRYHEERLLFQTTKLSPTLCSPPKPGCSNPPPVVAVRPYISIPAAKRRSDRVPSTQHLRRTVHMCGTVRVRVYLGGLRQVACICYICVPHRDRHRRPGRLLRSRCHQDGFLSFLLRGEPPVLPVAWSLVFGFPVGDSITAVAVRVCADNQLRVDMSSLINPGIHRYGNEEAYFLVTRAAYVYVGSYLLDVPLLFFFLLLFFQLGPFHGSFSSRLRNKHRLQHLEPATQDTGKQKQCAHNGRV